MLRIFPLHGHLYVMGIHKDKRRLFQGYSWITQSQDYLKKLVFFIYQAGSKEESIDIAFSLYFRTKLPLYTKLKIPHYSAGSSVATSHKLSYLECCCDLETVFYLQFTEVGALAVYLFLEFSTLVILVVWLQALPLCFLSCICFSL